MMNRPDTLGRRIQAGRHAAGLSQEALGEQLEVSRQAVSKWEADAAVPELEKLVAMSRLFGVTVGALLGVEPPAAEGTAPVEDPAAAEAAAETSDREIGAALAAWYAASRPRRRLAGAVGCLLAAALLVTLGVLAFRENGQSAALERRLAALEAQVAALAARAAQPAPGDGEGGLVLDYDLTPTGVDTEAGTVTLRVSATPREQAAGAAGAFTAQLSDGRRLKCEAVYDRGAFTVEGWAVPLDGRIEIFLTLTEGESSRTGLLETLHDYGPESAKLSVFSSWTSSPRGRSVRWHGGLWLTIQANSELARRLDLAPEAVDLCLYRNREEEPEQVLALQEVPELFREDPDMGVEIVNRTGYEMTTELAPGDVAGAAVRIRDTWGRTTYHFLSAWRLPEGADTVEALSPGPPEDWVPGTPLDENIARK